MGAAGHLFWPCVYMLGKHRVIWLFVYSLQLIILTILDHFHMLILPGSVYAGPGSRCHHFKTDGSIWMMINPNSKKKKNGETRLHQPFFKHGGWYVE